MWMFQSQRYAGGGDWRLKIFCLEKYFYCHLMLAVRQMVGKDCVQNNY